jgi:hypothetical protein
MSEFVGDDEVEAHEMLGEAEDARGPSFSLELVHQVDDVEDATVP